MPQNVAPYIPEIWASEALIWLRNQIVMARLVHRDFDDEVANFGDTVNARRPMTFTAADFTGATTYTDLEPENVQVVLDKWKHVSFKLDDKESSLALRGDRGAISAVFAEHFGPAAAALAEAIDSDLLGLYVDVSTSVGADGTDIVPDTIVDAQKRLNDQKAPAGSRFLAISSKDQAALLKTDKFTSAEYDPQNVDGLRRASLGGKYGFEQIFWSQLVKVVTGPDSTKNLAFHRNAFALVMRPLEAAVPGAGAIARTVVDEESGLAVRLSLQYDIDTKTTKASLDVLYGVKTLDANLATVVRS